MDFKTLMSKKEEDEDETKTGIFSLARGEIHGAKKRGLGRETYERDYQNLGK